ncbi:MAG: hypothetical protein KC766_09875 [Myxococcales bacterium]|nr:hypothetical protein [Myxococcales bacterium]
MSLSPRELMLLHDGELDPDAESEALERLRVDENAQAQLAGLEQLGDFLREAERAAAEPSFSSLADAVLERLDEPALRPLGESHQASSTHPERGWVVAVGVVLAAAAAGLLWIRSSHPVESRPTANLSQPASPQAPSAERPAPVAEEDPVAIVSVDFGGNDGTIFVVGDDSTPVVWLADDAVPAEDAKMGPL